MKNKFFPWLIFGIALIVSVSIQAFSAENEMSELSSQSNTYRYTFTSDTITNSELDTLTIPVLLLSQWSAHYAFKVNKLTGTSTLKFVVDENDYSTGEARGWVAKDSVTVAPWATDSIGHGRLSIASVPGIRQRVRVVGSGTQSSLYSVASIFKKP